MSVQVLIADDETLIRQSISTTLRWIRILWAADER